MQCDCAQRFLTFLHQQKSRENSWRKTMVPLLTATQIVPQPRASVKWQLVTSKVDLCLWTRSPRQRRCLICKSKLDREANQQRCQHCGVQYRCEIRRRCRWSPVDKQRGRELVSSWHHIWQPTLSMALRPGQAGLVCGSRWNPKTTTAPHRGCMCIGDEDMVPWAPSSDCQKRTQRSSACTPYHRVSDESMMLLDSSQCSKTRWFMWVWWPVLALSVV